MSRLERATIAAQLEAIAVWVADELAGGQPAKWVAQCAAAACLLVAAQVRDGGGRG